MKKTLKLIALAGMLGMTCAPAWADWVQVGENLGTTTAALDASSMAISANTPYVACREYSQPAHQIFMKHWANNTWVKDGGSLNANTGHDADWPSLAIRNGLTWVAWSEYNSSGTSPQIHAKQWNTGSWINGSGSININTGQYGGNPSLALASNGTPYIAWCEFRGTAPQIFVKHWSGSIWLENGGTGVSLNVSGTAMALYPSLAMSNNTPYVAWQELHSVNQIYVKHWNGSSWEQDGSASLNVNPGMEAIKPSLAVFNGTPYVAWIEDVGSLYRVFVKHLVGHSWVQDGGVDASLNVNLFQGTDNPHLAAFNNVLYAVWDERDATGTITQIYVKHLAGNAWVQDGGSLNVNPGKNAYYPSLAIANDGTPYVSWVESYGTGYSLFTKYYIPQDVVSAKPVYVKVYNSQINPNRGEKAAIRWYQPKSGSVTVAIYNLLGDKAISLVRNAGYSADQYHQVVWDGRNQYGDVVGSGIYVVDVKIGSDEGYSKIAVVK